MSIIIFVHIDIKLVKSNKFYQMIFVNIHISLSHIQLKITRVIKLRFKEFVRKGKLIIFNLIFLVHIRIQLNNNNIDFTQQESSISDKRDCYFRENN